MANFEVNQILAGHALDVVRTVPSGFVQTCVTSPPYWGLRDYGVEPSSWPEVKFKLSSFSQEITVPEGKVCLGLEEDPIHYIGHLVQIFREVRRVLRDDGTLWLNLGDTYASKNSPLAKSGSVVRLPWRLADALEADGWFLRNDAIWSKPNAMPETVTDRLARSHEYIFLLSKTRSYFYDTEDVRESRLTESGTRDRNRRTVWDITVKPFKGAHFATFPPELPNICIRAGTSEMGACRSCGAPLRRLVQIEQEDDPAAGKNAMRGATHIGSGSDSAKSNRPGRVYKRRVSVEVIGWEMTCTHALSRPKPCVVLDPFAGSGTTLSEADKLGRAYLGVEINTAYHTIITRRLMGLVEDPVPCPTITPEVFSPTIFDLDEFNPTSLPPASTDARQEEADSEALPELSCVKT
jgi:DNA modification methylase